MQLHEMAVRSALLFEADEPSRFVYAICDGWACRFQRFQTGRRHILNFLIPGDFVFGRLADWPKFSFQALTDIRYCKFAYAEVRARILKEPLTYEVLNVCNIAEREQIAATSAALGQFSASERIAQLVLQLWERLAARRMVRDNSCLFPLRQPQIADATGLTTVHVNRTLSTFCKDGIFAIKQGMLQVFDLSKLRQIGEAK